MADIVLQHLKTNVFELFFPFGFACCVSLRQCWCVVLFVVVFYTLADEGCNLRHLLLTLLLKNNNVPDYTRKKVSRAFLSWNSRSGLSLSPRKQVPSGKKTCMDLGSIFVGVSLGPTSP